MDKKSPWTLVFVIAGCLSILLACGVSQKVPAPTGLPAQANPPPAGPADTATLPPTLTSTWTSLPPTFTPTWTIVPPTETAAFTATPTKDPLMIAQKLGLHTTLATGEKKYVVILADFPDVQRKFPEAKLSERMLNFLNSYFSEASYQQLNFEGGLTKRYMLPHPVSYYKISPHNLEVDKSKIISLVTDVVNAADADIEFSQDLFVMISLGATQEDYGMVGYSAVPGMLNFKSESPLNTKSGEVINNAVVFCETAHLGTYVHDTLHMLGGVIDDQRMTPCLYDQDLQAKYPVGEDWAKILINIGYWDPLSSHFPYKRELPPTGLTSWTKLRLGWIDPSRIALVEPGETATVRLDPLESDDAATLVIKIPLTEQIYYLIENRQSVDSDVNLPSSGVLVLYADDTIPECRHGKAPVKIMDANPDVPYFNDAAFDIGKKTVYIDQENNLAIVLLRKDGLSYDIQVTTPDQVPQ